MRYMLTDDLWAALQPLVRQAKGTRRGPPPKVPDRQFFEGLLYLARTGIPWRDLPAEFGRWEAVYNRFRRWVAFGGLRRLFELLTADPAFGDIRRVFIDSTVVRARQHAAGAWRKKKKIGAGRSARSQALGRSRGGLSTEVVVTAADEDTAPAVVIVPGPAHAAPTWPGWWTRRPPGSG